MKPFVNNRRRKKLKGEQFFIDTHPIYLWMLMLDADGEAAISDHREGLFGEHVA